MLKFEHPKEQSNIIKVIGVGGGGSNAVTHMYRQGIKGVDFVLCNTDAQALEVSPVPNKIHLGKRQLGAGNIPSVGREAAIETITEIRELLEPHTKMLFITAGMGGGTGTGAAPVVASVANELDILTVGIVTLPFSFEGRKRRQQALEGIDELRKYVDTLLIISNDKLREEYGDMKLTDAFKKADDVLTIASKSIAEIITVTGYINVDFEDVKTVMKNSGKAIMGSARAEGENRAIKAIEEAMRSPLLNDSNIAGAKNILLYITSGKEEVTLDEVHEITDYIQSICGDAAEVIWGNGDDENLGNSIAITIIATGFDSGEPILPEQKRPTRVVDINGVEISSQSKPQNTFVTPQPEARTPLRHLLEPDNAVTEKVKPETFRTTDAPKPANPEIIVHKLFEDVIETQPSEGKIADSEPLALSEPEAQNEEPITFRIKDASELPLEVTNNENAITIRESQPQEVVAFRQANPESEDMDIARKSLDRQAKLKARSTLLRTTEGIEQLEKQPAFMRKGINIAMSSENENLSRYSINSEDGKISLRPDNPFLHDNVD
ncbi:MAG TPA: cell division protein FtsZ [Bacteroidales bacterium]|nr:cell division protein FtsZ [Bacteroidales bacterium]